MAHIITLEKSETLNRGERLIMVNGVAWGRTNIHHHGPRASSYTFSQMHSSDPNDGQEIGDMGKSGRYFNAIEVRNKKPSPFSKEVHRPTDEIVLEKAMELIAAGRLRDPAIVAAEVEQRRTIIRENMARSEQEKRAEFDQRARLALRINDSEPSELVDRVVAAMRWAQGQ